MKAWLRSVAATAAGLMAGTAAQAQFGQPHPGPGAIPTVESGAPEAEPDINGRPFYPKPKDPCPRFPILHCLLFEGPFVEQCYLTPGVGTWTLKNSNIPFAVATTGVTGILGNPGTRVVLGNSELDYGNYSSWNLNGGFMWANSGAGVEASYYTLDKNTITGQATSAANPVLARPFFDTNLNGGTGAQNVREIASPGRFGPGSVSFASSSQMWGADLLGVVRCIDDGSWKFDVLVGGKYLRLQEDLYIRDTSTVGVNGAVFFNGTSLNAGNTTQIVDGTNTITQFYGGTVGARTGYSFGSVSVNSLVKLTLGDSSNTVLGRGTTMLNPGTPGAQTANGGLLVTGLNNTRRQIERVGFMPELGLGATWTPLQFLSFNIGYNFAYLNNVVRPGDQFDTTVNPTFVPTSPSFGVPFGPAAPSAKVQFSDIWFSTFTAGITLRY